METQRFNLTEAGVLVEGFTSLDTVTITLWDLSDDSVEPLTSAACSEIATSGLFSWALSNITTYPTSFTEFAYQMSNGATAKEGKVILFTDNLPAADICRVTVNMYEADGTCRLEADDLFDPNKKNYIELKTSFFADSRYFKLAKYKPSYSQGTGQGYWDLPQLSTVDVKVESIGVDSPGLVVPALSTVDLNTWINT